MNLWTILIFKNSRKVGLGIWLFIVACIFLGMKLITSEQWFTTIALASALVGGGTWLDGKLSIEKQKISHPKE